MFKSYLLAGRWGLRYLRHGSRNGCWCVWLLAIAIYGVAALSSTVSLAKTVISSVNYESDSNFTRFELKLSDQAGYRAFMLHKHPRLVVDVENAELAKTISLPKSSGLISNIRIGKPGDNATRIVFDLKRQAKLLHSHTVKKSDTGGMWIVVELLSLQKVRRNVAQRFTAAPMVAPVPLLRPFLVVIDPGHGGIDSGTSYGSLLEKEIVLAFSKELRTRINGLDGYRAILTRLDDRKIPLEERAAYASLHRADLFISVHIDAVTDRSVAGIAVYTLSTEASDDEAALLAQKENDSHVEVAQRFDRKRDDVNRILIDLESSANSTESRRFARSLVNSFAKKITLLGSRPHRHADFKVLRNVSVPSVLLELGFISNRRDRENMSSPFWRANVASMMLESIINWRAQASTGRLAMK